MGWWFKFHDKTQGNIRVENTGYEKRNNEILKHIWEEIARVTGIEGLGDH